MKYSLQLTGLPFQPSQNQVFYVDRDDRSPESQWVRDHYEALCRFFSENNKSFIYYPRYMRQSEVEKQVRYFAPYLSTAAFTSHTFSSNHLLTYMCSPGNQEHFKASLICFDGDEGNDVYRFWVLEIGELIKQGLRAEQIGTWLIDLASPPLHEEEACRVHKSKSTSFALFSLKEKCLSLDQFCLFDEDEIPIISEPCMSEEDAEDAQSMRDTRFLLEELERTVQQLQISGVSLDAIHELIDKQQTLSRMVITEDYRIFLPDYNHMEITMGALPKTLFFFFLRYPEGVILKHLPDYYNELCVIYRQLRPRTDEATLAETITKLVNPTRNAANENIARIRKAFVEKFDERLAKHYIVRGTAGCEYKIALDRDLVIWEEDE